MDFNKLKDKAQQVYQERGGATAAKGDGQELKDILQGEGSLMDKAKRAGEALKTPGAAQDPASNAPSARTSPPSEQPEASVAPPESRLPRRTRGRAKARSRPGDRGTLVPRTWSMFRCD